MSLRKTNKHEYGPVQVIAKCPACRMNYEFAVDPHQSFAMVLFERGGWVNAPWRCGNCATPSLTYAEAMKAMVDGEIVMLKTHQYRQYRIKDWQLQTRDSYEHGRWGEWEDLNHYPEGHVTDKWKVVEDEE